VGLDLRNIDCMKLMAEYPDKHFDLAIVDPPYGIDYGNVNKFGKHTGKAFARSKDYGKTDWDKSAPNSDYFDLLQRKSKNQIIWGANHFIDNMPFNVSSPCWIVWDKKTGDNLFADCELAWTSFKTAVRKFDYMWKGMFQEKMHCKEVRIHATQKPVDLYKWLLKNYAKEGDKILDTHLGSGSIAIACHDYKFDLVASEIDKEYYDATMKRVSNHLAQTVLF